MDRLQVIKLELPAFKHFAIDRDITIKDRHGILLRTETRRVIVLDGIIEVGNTCIDYTCDDHPDKIIRSEVHPGRSETELIQKANHTKTVPDAFKDYNIDFSYLALVKIIDTNEGYYTGDVEKEIKDYLVALVDGPASEDENEYEEVMT